MIWKSTARYALATTFLVLGFGTAATAAPITYEVFIQPIQICDDAGNNCANPTKELFEAEGDKIWAQAGSDLKFLSWASVNETDFLDLRVDQDNNSFIDPGEDFDILRSDPTSYGGSGDAMVLNMWFADLLDSSAGFYGVTECAGCRNIAIGWDAVAGFGTNGRLDTIAHEIGHSLGLGHGNFGAGGADNLMTSGGSRSIPSTIADIEPDGLGLDKLTEDQITEAQSSVYVKDVIPEPASLSVLGIGLLAGGTMIRRRRRS